MANKADAAYYPYGVAPAECDIENNLDVVAHGAHVGPLYSSHDNSKMCPGVPSESFMYWLAKRDQELKERFAAMADSVGHHWSGAPAHAFFDLAEEIRNTDITPVTVVEKRAPVQGEYVRDESGSMALKNSGTISWDEHEKAYEAYASRFGTGQTSLRIAQRGGFSYDELTMFLGHEPETFQSRKTNNGQAKKEQS